ncbi:transglutaminase family protein [Halopiger thermotolerans]
MSADSRSPAASDSRTAEKTGPVGVGAGSRIDTGPFRPLALGCVVLLTASYLSVLYEVTRIVGGTRSLLLLVATMLVAATALARAIRPRTATATALVAAGLGFAYYLETSGVGVAVVTTATDAILADVITLATGLELLQMVEAGVWTLGFAPGPVFLSWYLAVRGRYGLSVLPGGFALFFLVLTGDAGTAVTLLGTVAALGAVGFGELERRGGSGAVAQIDLLAVTIAAIVVLSLSVTVVPGEPARPATSGLETGAPGTLEGAIDSAGDRSRIAGTVELSPDVRFRVESERPSYWRTGVYDRYTGDGWIRTGQTQALEGSSLDPPPGQYDTVTQVVTAETELGVMPAAPHPVGIDGEAAEDATVSIHGQVRPRTTLLEGDSYTVESAVPTPAPGELNAAGTDYPAEIEEYYLQTPESLSPAFEERTAEITASADTPYETARVVERHLRSSKSYSLEVDRPEGDVAEAFLLEMDEGYCVYFATTMTQMLRSEGIPARYVTGYTTGEQVGDDEYVVRGVNAHAWVEVYFPGQGWVPFDPTPPNERETAHQAHLADAGGALAPGADDPGESASPEDNGSQPDEPDGADDDPSEDEPDADPATGNESASQSENGSDARSDAGADGSDGEPDAANGTDGDAGGAVPSALRDVVTVTRETALLAAVALVGVAAAVRRTDATARARRTVGLYWQGRRGDPDRDAERAFRRLERLLARTYRPRRRSESPRQYLTALAAAAEREAAADSNPLPLDDRAERVLECYERAVYGGGVDREAADEAIAHVDELVRERLPIIGRDR